MRFNRIARAGIIAVAMMVAAVAAAAPAPTPLVSTDWLKGELGTEMLAVIDLRPAAAFAAGHVPAAVQSDFPGAWRARGGKVPEAADFEAMISGLGIGNDSMVVIVPAGTDNTDFGAAARVYWSFKYLGHDAVAILDGGWKAWAADAANPVAQGPAAPTAGSFRAALRPELLATTPEVVAKVDSAILIDARPAGQYRGDGGAPGHIPGAINLENDSFFDATAGRLKPREALAALVPGMVASEPGKEVIAYCNSGWWSATNWFVLHEMLGRENTALYVESMPGWISDPSRPVERSPGG